MLKWIIKHQKLALAIILISALATNLLGINKNRNIKEDYPLTKASDKPKGFPQQKERMDSKNRTRTILESNLSPIKTVSIKTKVPAKKIVKTHPKKLKLKLIGVFFGRKEKKVLISKGGKKEKFYVNGDNIAAGASIKNIGRSSVTIQYFDDEISLLVNESKTLAELTARNKIEIRKQPETFSNNEQLVANQRVKPTTPAKAKRQTVKNIGLRKTKSTNKSPKNHG